jgi:hypothetical protein
MTLLSEMVSLYLLCYSAVDDKWIDAWLFAPWLKIDWRGARSKGSLNWAKNGVGLSAQAGRPRAFWPGSAPASSSVASRAIPYLYALACGPLTSFPSRLRHECLPYKLRCFLVESFKVCTLTLRSLGHLESCSSRVLTLVRLHDLLPKFLMNLSRKSPL